MMNSNMLHNTGPYGPNESPVNVGAPDMSELATPMSIAQNFNNIVKMSQQTNHPPQGHFNFQNYSGLASTSFDNNAQFNMFSSNHFQSGTSAASFFSHSIRHNRSLQENYHVKKELDQEVMDFSNFAHKFSRFGASAGELKIHHTSTNVPQISDKNIESPKSVSNHTTIGQNDNLFAPWKSLDQRESEEQTLDMKVITQVNNTENNLNTKTSNDSDNLHLNFNQDDKESQSNHTEDIKTINKYSKQYDSDNNDASNKEYPFRELEDTGKFNNKEHSNCDSDSDDSKPLNLVYFIKQEPLDPIETGDVVVKVEQISSWTDTEHMQPFLKDSNGLMREDSSLENVVDCINSIAKAREIIKTGLHTDLTFECPNCCLVFSHPKRFLIHTKWHAFGLTNDRRSEEAKEKIACRQQKKEMQTMIKKEAAALSKKDNQQAFNCKNCDKTFNTKSKLRNHRHKYHPSREHECKVCQKKVLGWFGLQTHMATHNKDLYECDICSKTYKHAHSLSKHRDSHLEKTHACAECPKKFGSQKLLKIHMKSHERAQRGRTFRCSYCSKGFYEAYTLQYHERTHRNERPFKCEICQTCYGTNSSLKRHLKVSHSDAKPFKCATCHRCFSTALIRDRHAARVHGTPGGLQYPCTECTSRYMRLKDLQRHMYRIHPKGKKRRKDSDSE